MNSSNFRYGYVLFIQRYGSQKGSDLISSKYRIQQDRKGSPASHRHFFRDADVALLMFDVGQVDTLQAFTKWWSEFREKASVLDNEVDTFCCVCVGNKIDLLCERGHDDDDSKFAVARKEALRFINDLIPSKGSVVAGAAFSDLELTHAVDTRSDPDLQKWTKMTTQK